MAQPVGLADVQAAQKVISGVLHRTPTVTSGQLSRRIGADIFLKAELFQKTGSFKARGVVNRLHHLTALERERGLITVSSGNHAQALAWAAGEAGIAATVFMPASASPVKVEASTEYGAKVVLHETVHEALAKADAVVANEGLVMIHPFDDPRIIAGAGTLGLEIAEDVEGVDVVVCPVGGGGLLSGVAVAIRGLYPKARIIGVEPEGAAVMTQALAAGSLVRLETTNTVADGLAPPTAGVLTLEIAQLLVDEVVTMPDEEILEGMRALMRYAKLFAEPSGGAAFGALLSGRVAVRRGERVVAIVSGGNLDLERLRTLAAGTQATS